MCVVTGVRMYPREVLVECAVFDSVTWEHGRMVKEAVNRADIVPLVLL